MNPSFSGEVQLAGWGEAHNSGCKVTFWLSDATDLDAFRLMTLRKGNTSGQRLAMVLVEIGEDELPVIHEPIKAIAATPKREPNRLAQKLMIDGYFNNPKLWSAVESAGIYTQSKHKAHVESLPCCEGDGFCNGDVVLHHVRTAANSGTGIKPPHWFGVPICHYHHAFAHSSNSDREYKNHLLEKSVALTSLRVKEAIKSHLKIDSLNLITIQMLNTFELDISL